MDDLGMKIFLNVFEVVLVIAGGVFIHGAVTSASWIYKAGRSGHTYFVVSPNKPSLHRSLRRAFFVMVGLVCFVTALKYLYSPK